MPYFKVLVEGSGFQIPGPSGEPSIVGFFVSRIVRANQTTEASALALRNVLAEWSAGYCSHYNVSPNVTVSEVKRVGFLSGVLAKQTGYSFHQGQ